MANEARRAMAGLAMVMVMAAATETHAAGRVRAKGDLAALIAETVRRSPTFRQMVEAIEASDGLVFVERGRCGAGVRARLVFLVTVAGPNRLLSIMLDDRSTDAQAMGSLGHELQHVLEVLAEPTVTSKAAMHFFYLRNAKRIGDAFETDAAILAGDTVRAELHRARLAEGAR